MRYDLDPDASRVVIHASSSVHPIDTEARIRGWIDLEVSAAGALDPAGEVAAHVEVPLAGLRSGNPLIDREAERRLDVRRHPVVTGDLRSLGPVADDDDDDDGAAAGEDRSALLVGDGDLTFHGVTAPIRGTLQIVPDGDRLHLRGETTIDVTDFGVQPPSLLVVKVHRTVRVDLDAVAVPTADADAPS